MSHNLSAYDHLGFFSPYYCADKPEAIPYPRFEDVLPVSASSAIDTTAVLEYLNRRYFLADRTLLRGVRKNPWMTEIANTGERRQADLPPHGLINSDPESIASGLKLRLRTELRQACSKAQRILLPLSGGMDSRVVAAVLWELKRAGEIDATIDTVTWGVKGCRDVIYAERLAGLLGWNWTHLPLTPEELRDNVDVAVRLGCEFSALHLHAMTALRNLPGYDLVLVASFGDSVGRARYSGRHVSHLDPMLPLYNPYGLMRHAVYRRDLVGAVADATLYQRLFPRSSQWASNEIDQQAHYWYRMLNPVWAYVNERIPVYQCFGAPAVFGYMWNFAPECRNDWPYYHLVASINERLLTVPWAKTGGCYPAGPALDTYGHVLAPYGQWTREDLADYVATHLFDGVLDSMAIFNIRNIKTLFHYMKKGDGVESTHGSELLLWLASLSKAVTTHGLRIEHANDRYHAKDFFTEYLITPLYVARHFYGPRLKQRLRSLSGASRH